MSDSSIVSGRLSSLISPSPNPDFWRIDLIVLAAAPQLHIASTTKAADVMSGRVGLGEGAPRPGEAAHPARAYSALERARAPGERRVNEGQIVIFSINAKRHTEHHSDPCVLRTKLMDVTVYYSSIDLFLTHGNHIVTTPAPAYLLTALGRDSIYVAW